MSSASAITSSGSRLDSRRRRYGSSRPLPLLLPLLLPSAAACSAAAAAARARSKRLTAHSTPAAEGGSRPAGSSLVGGGRGRRERGAGLRDGLGPEEEIKGWHGGDGGCNFRGSSAAERHKRHKSPTHLCAVSSASPTQAAGGVHPAAPATCPCCCCRCCPPEPPAAPAAPAAAGGGGSRSAREVSRAARPRPSSVCSQRADWAVGGGGERGGGGGKYQPKLNQNRRKRGKESFGASRVTAWGRRVIRDTEEGKWAAKG